jgi:copper homeostasis protein CutC
MELIREACVETKEQLDNALEKHAEQIELCSRLDLGGLTPNHDLIEYALNKSNNILIMIRNNDNFSTSFFDL